MYNIQKNSKKAITTLEALTKSLDKRYEKKNEVKTKNITENIANLDLDLKNKDKSTLDVNSNIDKPAQNGTEKQGSKDHIVTHQKLYNIINQKCTSFFILDTRSAAVSPGNRCFFVFYLNISRTILIPTSTSPTLLMSQRYS